MAVGLFPPKKLLPVAGVELASTAAGIRYTGRDDLVLITLAEGSTVSAVFTQNHFCAAPVTLAKAHMASSPTRAWLINSGNANAVTGVDGMRNAQRSCAAVAEILSVTPSNVLPFSTGVIGEQLNMGALLAGIDVAGESLNADNWLSAAHAIMTTDTVAKGVSSQLEIDGVLVTITGIAKGSGMICPDMATMLAYVATDANIEQTVLDALLKRGAAASFNRISVDSDTSTNDALVLAATGQSDAPSISQLQAPNALKFYQALEPVLIELATAIVRDGEGATKFVKVVVDGGKTESDCAAIAYTIAHSPLVKTALFASDPNWGRILMALGKAPVEHLNPDLVDININQVALIKQGELAPGYTEQAGQGVFQQPEITIQIALNSGTAEYHVWTSDLSHEYVSINADYRS